jgi:flagellar M-ring protein FliF
MEVRTMDFLRQTWLQVQEHLKGLTLSQKMVIGLCAGMIAMSMAWLMHWSATPDMVALLDQSFQPSQLASAQRELQKCGVSYTVSGDRILLPADKRDLALARLQESEALPTDTTIGFTKLMEQQSIWMSNEERIWQRDLALGNELARVLKNFTGVRSARVFIERPNKRGFGDNHTEPKASVQLTMKENAAVSHGFVQAVASFVSGAVVGLKPENVSIVDSSGKPYRIRNKDTAMAADLLADTREQEEHYADKIRSQLAFISGILVNVRAEPETEAKRIEDRQVKAMAMEEETTSNNERAAANQGEPGVTPNTAASVPTGPTGSNRDETVEHNKYGPGDQKTTVTQNMVGAIKRLTASVNVPRSYMIQAFKQRSGQDKTPTDQELETLITDQLARIRAQVKPLISATNDDQVQVDCFYDVLPAQAEVALAASSNVKDLFAEYGRPASLAALAALSLTLMLMLVRKAQPPMPVRLETAGTGASRGGAGGTSGNGGNFQLNPDGTIRRQPEELLTVEGTPVGKAQPTQPILEGREVDEQTLKSQQIIDQVNSLVKEDPDSVASMLRKWIEEVR